MIVLSDCLTNKIDEGCLKVANSLTKRLKKADASTMVISFERKPDYSDIHMSLNKFFLNKRLCEIMHQKKEPVLYIPFASNTKPCKETLDDYYKNTIPYVFFWRRNRYGKFF